MTQQIRVLVRGENGNEARVAHVTRVLALRLFCDCYRCAGAVSVKSSVFLVALDRDELRAYVKHASDPEDSPWELQAMDAYHQIKAIGVKLSLPDRPAVEPSSIDDALALAAESQAPWWDRSDDEAEERNRKREAKKLAEIREWERKRSLGLVEPDGPEKPKESKYAEAKRKRDEARYAQPPLDLPMPEDDQPRDIDDRE